MTKRDAAEKWLSQFNAISTNMIEALHKADFDSWHEVTKPRAGHYVFHYPSQENGEIVKVYDFNEEVDVDFNGTVETVSLDDITVEHDSVLPMWGTMWSFGSRLDDYWLVDNDGLQAMSDCGFRIYEHDDFGYFFGIDGAGYSFYEEHWIPLYEARGLQWHDKELDKKPSLIDTLKAGAEKSHAMFGEQSSAPLEEVR